MTAKWHPPTPQRISLQLEDHFHIHTHIDPANPGDEHFYYLYNRQVGEEGETIEVLPGLFGKVSNYYVNNPGSFWRGSQVWILVSDAQDWLATHTPH